MAHHHSLESFYLHDVFQDHFNRVLTQNMVIQRNRQRTDDIHRTDETAINTADHNPSNDKPLKKQNENEPDPSPP